MSTLLIPLLAAAVAFAAILLIGLLLANWRSAAARNRSIALVSSYAAADVHRAVAEVESGPPLYRMLLVEIGNRFVTPRWRARIQQQLIYAGMATPDAVDSALVRKVLFLVIGLLVGLLLGSSAGGSMWLAVPVLGIGGFFVPDLLIANAGAKREQEIAIRLPDALDMLNLCVESGLSFQAALAQVAANQTGPVADEFAQALGEMQYGRSRGQALSAMGERTKQPDMQRFVSAMLQVDKLGVPVSSVLREQAREMRAKRYSRAREQAQKVPVKILMPLMLCFLPALFIIILAPAVASLSEVL